MIDCVTRKSLVLLSKLETCVNVAALSASSKCANLTTFCALLSVVVVAIDDYFHHTCNTQTFVTNTFVCNKQKNKAKQQAIVKASRKRMSRAHRSFACNALRHALFFERSRASLASKSSSELGGWLSLAGKLHLSQCKQKLKRKRMKKSIPSYFVDCLANWFWKLLLGGVCLARARRCFWRCDHCSACACETRVSTRLPLLHRQNNSCFCTQMTREMRSYQFHCG